MDLLPENEILKGHWQVRVRTLQEDVLDRIPFTTGQKADIAHHLTQLENLFAEANKKVTTCTKEVEGGAALCGVKLDCHVHDWRADKETRDDMEKLTMVALWLIKILCLDTNATTASVEQDVTHQGKEVGRYKITVKKL